ncbi:MAG: hypothetical protein E6Q99_02460, partial [Elusimicrobia bacterium]
MSISTSSTLGPAGHWLPGRVDIPAKLRSDPSAQHEIAFCTVARRPDVGKPANGEPGKTEPAAPPVGTAVWGSPELWSLDEGAAGPNVLLVLIDTLRADALSAMPRLSQ